MASTATDEAGRLKRKLQRLTQKNRLRRQDDEVQAAISEAHFRLGVHPQMRAPEAIKHIQAAFRLDGSNPKYAYHLGRLYYQHGKLEQAAHWLRISARLCPTSHRIWAHISLLQRELNTGFIGVSLYEPDALKERSERIAQKIRTGEDRFERDLLDFTPPRSLASIEAEARKASKGAPGKKSAPQGEESKLPEDSEFEQVDRTLDPGRCRWSGIRDLAAEHLLEARANPRNRDRLLPLLQGAITSMELRKNGQAAFAALVVEWLIAGYPVATVRRLLAEQSDKGESRSLDLVDQVCSLYEAELDHLPARLAQALKQNQIPALMAALIHKSRLLWRPLKFERISAYRTAKSFLDAAKGGQGAGEGQAQITANHIKSLSAIGKALRSPPPQPMPDAAPESEAVPLDAQTALEELAGLESESRTLLDIQGRAYAFLKERLVPIATQADDQNQRRIDYQRFSAFVGDLQETAAGGLVQLERLSQGIQGVRDAEVDGDFGQRMEACRNRYNKSTNLGNFKRILRRIEKRLEKTQTETASAKPNPSDDLLALIKELKGIMRMGEDGADEQGHTEDRLAHLEAQADEMNAVLDRYWGQLKKLTFDKTLQITDEDQAFIEEVIRFVGKVEAQSDEAFETIDDLRASSPEAERLDRVLASYQNLRARPSRFRRKLNRIAMADQASNADEEGSSTSDRTSTDQHEALGIGALARAIKVVEAEAKDFYDAANALFDPYSPQQRQQPPIRLLRNMVRGREAETYYRMGQREKARRIWNRILLEDRLNLKVLKNIAVCESRNPEISRSLDAWRRYCETLYYHAIARGDASHGANQRAAFHRDFAAAYAPRSLQAKLDREWREKVDEEAVTAFVRSPARLRAYFDHKLLEFCNRKFAFSSPTLVLGVSRSETQEMRAKAKKSLSAFTEEMCALLPGNSGAAFSKVCRRHLEQAFEVCQETGLGLKRDQSYPAEEKRQIHWVTDVCHLLFKLILLLNSEKAMAAAASFECLEQLCRFERVPLGLSQSLLETAARTLPTQTPEELLSQYQQVQKSIAATLLKSIFSTDQDQADAAARRGQYLRLVRDGLDQPAIGEYRDLIDDPQQFYPSVVIEALQEGRDVDSAIEELRKWCEMFPASTGPARYLAILLSRKGESDEPITLIERAIEHAIDEKARSACLEILFQFRFQKCMNSGRFEDAIQLVEKEPAKLDHIEHLGSIFSQWIQARPQEGQALIEEINNHIDRFLERAEDSVEEKARARAIDLKRKLVIQAALADKGDLDENSDWGEIVKAMDLILQSDGDNLDAVHLKMVSCFRVAQTHITRMEKSEAKDYLRQAGQLADRVFRESDDENKRQQAQQVKEQVGAAAESLGGRPV